MHLSMHSLHQFLKCQLHRWIPNVGKKSEALQCETLENTKRVKVEETVTDIRLDTAVASEHHSGVNGNETTSWLGDSAYVSDEASTTSSEGDLITLDPDDVHSIQENGRTYSDFCQIKYYG